jgi:hypothetical protein
MRPVNAVVESPQAMAQTSHHHIEIHRRLRVHEIGGLREIFWGTRLVPALRRRLQGLDLGQNGLEKSEHHLH